MKHYFKFYFREESKNNMVLLYAETLQDYNEIYKLKEESIRRQHKARAEMLYDLFEVEQCTRAQAYKLACQRGIYIYPAYYLSKDYIPEEYTVLNRIMERRHNI